jgi:GNAT superfamily N-acetyltransferase
MSTSFTLREMQPSDGPALRALMENDPPSTGMSVTTRFLVDPYQAWKALKPSLIGVVAEASDGLVGTATIAFDDMQFDGRVLPSGFLENLKVHHAYRGQGLGTQLAQWRIDAARTRYGDDCVIVTGTTSDNVPSLATMKKWAKQFIGPLMIVPRPQRSHAPKPLSGVTIRPVEARDYAEIVDKSNRFFADYNLYTPLSAAKFDGLLNTDTPHKVYQYRVAVDAGGNLLAGALISERARLMVDDFHNVPTPLALANRLLHMLPSDGVLRLSEVGSFWFDKLEAAQHLWEHIRWEFREHSNSFSSGYDPRSALGEVFQVKPWHMPKIQIRLALTGPTLMSEDRLLANAIRG